MAKFKWTAPSKEELNEANNKQKEGRASLYDKITKSEFPVFTPQKGENHIRLLPPTHGNRRYFPLEIFVHYGVGPDNGSYLCNDRMFQEDCAVCEEWRALKEAGDTKAANEIRPTNGFIAWVIDRNDKDDKKGPQLYRYGYMVSQNIATVAIDKDDGGTLCVFHPDEGYDLYFTKEPQGGDARNVKYLGFQFNRRPSPVHRSERIQDEWLDFIEEHPLDTVLQKYSYEHIAKCFKGKHTVREDETEDDDGQSGKLAERTSRSLREEIDDEIPERVGGNRAGEYNNGRGQHDEDDRSEANVSGRERDDDNRRSSRSRDEDDGDGRRQSRDAGDRDRGERDDPPFDGGTSRHRDTRSDDEEEPREERRSRPRLAREEEEKDPKDIATGAVSRLRERARETRRD